MFALNALRIAILMLIGNAGFPDVAAYGFHSQAGWWHADWPSSAAAVPGSITLRPTRDAGGNRQPHSCLLDALAGHTRGRCVVTSGMPRPTH